MQLTIFLFAYTTKLILLNINTHSGYFNHFVDRHDLGWGGVYMLHNGSVAQAKVQGAVAIGAVAQFIATAEATMEEATFVAFAFWCG